MFRLKETRIYSSVYIHVKEYACVLCISSVNGIINKIDVLNYFRSLALLWVSLAMKPATEYIYSSTKQRNER